MRRVLPLVLVLLVTCAPDLVPDDFEVPQVLETEHFRLRPLTEADAEKDYEAVVESREIIHRALMSDRWPDDSFTPEENRKDLRHHESMFSKRKRFTYTVVSLDESKVLGCVYINKGINGPDAAVFMWVRKTAREEGLDPILEETVRRWIAEEWPFEWVVYPGRDRRPVS
jgi:RimJ/RimL family protein N-acetyltransferase